MGVEMEVQVEVGLWFLSNGLGVVARPPRFDQVSHDIIPFDSMKRH